MTEESPGGSLTVGTAGHVDHGKTALVGALTGVDTDRLEEEKRRGLSIELGFAELDLGDGRSLGLVDAPGHERFVRTMIAGASGIDLFLLVVAADDGVMPQTAEHLAILRSLGLERGVVALSRCDLADAELRRVAAADCELLAPEHPLVEVSARTGEGIERLRGELRRQAAGLPTGPPGRSRREPLLHVDRAFTVVGHGTVVTGTLWSGALRRDQGVLLLPSGLEARVRGLEVHGRRVETAVAGQRVAVNLRGAGRDEVARGEALTVAGGEARSTYRLDIGLPAGPGAEAIAAEHRVQAHLGTRETPARVVDLGGGAVQLRLERPLIARRGDRVVIRRIAPPDTLGGAVVGDPAPRRRSVGAALAPEPEAEAGAAPPPASSAPGRLALGLLTALREDGARPRAPGDLATAAGVGRGEAERALRELARAGEIVQVKRDVFFDAASYASLRRRALAEVERRGSTSIAELRDALGLSRKLAQALLERLDGQRCLRREGNRHYPRRGAADT